jgi:hypothetical protein
LAASQVSFSFGVNWNWQLTELTDSKSGHDWLSVLVFVMDDFDQEAPALGSLSLLSVGIGAESVSMYMVVFHPDNLQKWVDDTMPWKGRTVYLLNVFENKQRNMQHASWGKRSFGFVCEGRYYLTFTWGSG